MTAIGAMGALRDLGYTVGRDVALVGFNDISIAAELPTPLTTVRSPLKEMGRRAAEVLLDRLDHHSDLAQPLHEVRLSPQLIVRESSDVSVPSRRLRDESSDRVR